MKATRVVDLQSRPAARLYKRGRIWWTWYYDRNRKKRDVSTRCRDRAAAEDVAIRIEREQAAAGWTPPESSGGRVVYFLRRGPRGPIKIGRSADLDQRLANAAQWSPEGLRVLLLVAGGAALEAAFHRAFADERMAGEWYRPSDRLLQLIDELRAADGEGHASEAAR